MGDHRFARQKSSLRLIKQLTLNPGPAIISAGSIKCFDSVESVSMTSFKIECPNCGRMYNLAEKFRGRKVTCASEACGTSFLASPLPDEELGDLNEEDPPSQKPVPSEQPEHALPPPLQMPRKTGSKRLVIVLATALGVILTTAISTVILMGSRNVSVQNLAQTKSEKKSTNEILREQILSLLVNTLINGARYEMA